MRQPHMHSPIHQVFINRFLEMWPEDQRPMRLLIYFLVNLCCLQRKGFEGFV